MSENQEFNQKELKKQKRVRLKRKFFKFSIFLIVFLVVLFVCVDYFARFPRERHAKNASYLKRASLGFSKYLKASKLVIEAENEDPKNTKLPMAELYIKGKRIDRLDEQLPFSGEEYQKAEFKIDDKTYKVEVKYKGDSINHWAFPQKSWRVRLNKDKLYNGIKTFNLNVPRLDTQIGNFLGYAFGKEMGISLVPEAKYVHFRLNRFFDGVRLFLEQPGQEFLLRRNLPVGKIYKGDISYLQIYGGVKREKLFSEADAWELDSPGDYLSGNSELKELLDIIAFDHNPYSFYDRISKIINVDDFLSYIALLEIVSSVHVDETHNNKLYFNPVSGKFSPIVWDTVAYHWKNKYNPDIAVNKLFRVLLSNPEFRERKDEIIYKTLNETLTDEYMGSIIRDTVKDIALDLKAFPLKLRANDKGIKHLSNQEWEESIIDLLNIVKKRNQKFKVHLTNSSASYKFKNLDKNSSLLMIDVSGPIGIKLKDLELELNNPVTNFNLVRRGTADLAYNDVENANDLIKVIDQKSKLKDFLYSVKLDDRLYSKRRYNNGKNPEVISGKYYYLINGATLKSVKLNAVNGVTGQAVSISENPKLKIAKTHKTNSVWWRPSKFKEKKEINISGVKTINEDLIVAQNEVLNIAAGATLKIAPNKSIIVYGKVNVNGKASRPVVVKSLDKSKPYGTFAINGGEGIFNFLNLSHGLGAKVNHVYYDAPLALHYAKLKISNSSFKNAHIVSKYSDVEITDSNYNGALDEPLVPFSSKVRKVNFNVEALKQLQAVSILNEEAFGTPGRTEREFKFSLIGVDTEANDLKSLALEVNKALTASLENSTSTWKAPKLVGNQFYIDKDIGKFLFRDYYFDTFDNLLYKNQISYRYRNRYSNLKEYKLHLKNPNRPEYWPYRLEFQAKVNRKEVGNGFSTVDEARFEFRKESKPFSIDNPPPAPPWNEAEFFNYFKSGSFRGLNTLPARVIIESIKADLGDKENVDFFSKLLLLTERFRQHFNIKSAYGSGPNPDQAYIISLDKVDVFHGNDYYNYVESRKLGDKDAIKPTLLGSILEIEVEFERNVSDVLDREISIAQKANDTQRYNKLVKVRDAFLSDLQNIMTVVKDYFAKKGIKVESATRSKYVQAVDLSSQ